MTSNCCTLVESRGVDYRADKSPQIKSSECFFFLQHVRHVFSFLIQLVQRAGEKCAAYLLALWNIKSSFCTYHISLSFTQVCVKKQNKNVFFGIERMRMSAGELMID